MTNHRIIDYNPDRDIVLMVSALVTHPSLNKCFDFFLITQFLHINSNFFAFGIPLAAITALLELHSNLIFFTSVALSNLYIDSISQLRYLNSPSLAISESA